jgi:hypothetical protein
MPKNREQLEKESRVPIIGIRIKDKKVIKFESLREAATYLGLNNTAAISRCLLKKRRKTHGFIFFYKNKFPGIENIDFGLVEERGLRYSRAVLAINNDEKIIFQTINEAAEFAGIHRATMRRYCKENKLYKNYIWSYKLKDKP